MSRPFKFQVNDVLMRRSSRAKYRPRYQVVIVAQGHLPVSPFDVIRVGSIIRLAGRHETMLITESTGLPFILASYFTSQHEETKIIVGQHDIDWFETAYKLFGRSE